MKVGGVPYRTIWDNGDGSVGIIDQTRLPHAFETLTLKTLADAAHAILEFSLRHAASEEGVVPYGQWPDGVKGHFITRTPPEGFIS